MTIGPVQMLVLGFDEPNFTGKIRAEFERLRGLDFIKIIDSLVVEKDDEGDRKTRVVDGACVFLNRPGFAGGSNS